MNVGVALNLGRFVAVLACSMAAAVYGLFNPDAVMPAATNAIAALSIIFGLSAAVSSLLIAGQVSPRQISNDPTVAKRVSDRLKRHDHRTIDRLKYMQTGALVAVVLGIAYQVAATDARSPSVTSVLAAGFAFAATFSLLFATALPSLFSHLQKRNDRIGR
jgi:hypothetical protein